MANWKLGYTREVADHAKTKKLVEEAQAATGVYEKNMWGAQRVAQQERVKFEEAERQRVAVESLVKGLQEDNARLTAERNLLAKLLRGEKVDGH